MSDLRALAESLGWKVWAYKEPVSLTSDNPYPDPPERSIYMLRSPSNAVFENGYPNVTVQTAIRQGDYVDGIKVKVHKRYSEADAWNDLPKTEAQIRAYSR